MESIRQHHISIKTALSGIVWAFKSQPNFRVHLILSAISLLLGAYLKVSFVEMTILTLAIVFGLGVEMVNTSIESLTDLITTKWHLQAKIAKDVSAGMMLLVAFGTIMVAALIFIPRISILITNSTL